jgi:hypothetical protein
VGRIAVISMAEKTWGEPHCGVTRRVDGVSLYTCGATVGAKASLRRRSSIAIRTMI